MYTPSQIASVIHHPGRIGTEVNRLYHGRISQLDDGVSIFEEDWDNLLILDACRYDVFEACSSLPGQLDQRRSLGATTSEFVRENFAGRTLHDTVYVSANIWYLKLRDELDAELHEFVNTQPNHWDEELGTVPPEAVSEAAREATVEFPNKRLIVHYLQPHQPYIGPTGREHFEVSPGLRETLHRSQASDDLLWTAYQENLNLVLESVGDLLPDLEGRTVITADHGEMLGERGSPIPVRTYGHFGGLYLDELVTVPWNIVKGQVRKEVVPEAPTKDASNRTESKQVDERLRELGYKI